MNIKKTVNTLKRIMLMTLCAAIVLGVAVPGTTVSAAENERIDERFIMGNDLRSYLTNRFDLYNGLNELIDEKLWDLNGDGWYNYSKDTKIEVKESAKISTKNIVIKEGTTQLLYVKDLWGGKVTFTDSKKNDKIIKITKNLAKNYDADRIYLDYFENCKKKDFETYKVKKYCVNYFEFITGKNEAGKTILSKKSRTNFPNNIIDFHTGYESDKMVYSNYSNLSNGILIKGLKPGTTTIKVKTVGYTGKKKNFTVNVTVLTKDSTEKITNGFNYYKKGFEFYKDAKLSSEDIKLLDEYYSTRPFDVKVFFEFGLTPTEKSWKEYDNTKFIQKNNYSKDIIEKHVANHKYKIDEGKFYKYSVSKIFVVDRKDFDEFNERYGNGELHRPNDSFVLVVNGEYGEKIEYKYEYTKNWGNYSFINVLSPVEQIIAFDVIDYFTALSNNYKNIVFDEIINVNYKKSLNLEGVYYNGSKNKKAPEEENEIAHNAYRYFSDGQSISLYYNVMHYIYKNIACLNNESVTQNN